MRDYEYNDLLKEGFSLSHYCDIKVKNIDLYELITLSADDLKDIILLNKKEPKPTKKKAIFIKVVGKVEFDVSDLIKLYTKITKANYKKVDEAQVVIGYMIDKRDYFGKNILFSSKTIDEIKKLKDPFFDYDSSLIYYSLEDAYNFECYEEEIDFINDILDNRELSLENKEYSEETLKSIILHMGYDDVLDYDTDEKILDFYRNNLVELANKDIYAMKQLLAYEYYDSRVAFENDCYKARDLFIDCFNRSHNPDLARTLGYIYYYGRCNNGVMEAEKAFQYFSYATLFGDNHESYIKLADCYYYGYGTFKDEFASFRLSNTVYDESKKYIGSGHKDCKYADACIRLGNYYKKIKDIFDEDLSHTFYLRAHAALFYRMRDNEYIGDNSVAFRLFKSLAEQEEYKTKRTILYNGYDVFKNRLFEYFIVNKVEVEDNLIHLYLDASNINNIVVFENIDFSEYSEELHFILTNSIKNKNDFLGLPHKHLISIDFNEGIINLHDLKKNCIYFDRRKELIYVPNTLKDVNKSYYLVKVGDYYVLSNKDHYIDDVVKYRGKEYTISEVNLTYEDKLVVPLEKMYWLDDEDNI